MYRVKYTILCAQWLGVPWLKWIKTVLVGQMRGCGAKNECCGAKWHCSCHCPDEKKIVLFWESFAHFSNILPRWGQNCPDSSSFCPLSKSGKEKVCFGVGLGVFCVRGGYPRFYQNLAKNSDYNLYIPCRFWKCTRAVVKELWPNHPKGDLVPWCFRGRDEPS